MFNFCPGLAIVSAVKSNPPPKPPPLPPVVPPKLPTLPVPPAKTPKTTRPAAAPTLHTSAISLESQASPSRSIDDHSVHSEPVAMLHEVPAFVHISNGASSLAKAAKTATEEDRLKSFKAIADGRRERKEKGKGVKRVLERRSSGRCASRI